MAKLDIYKPLLAPPDEQSIVPWLQIVQQVRGFVDHNIAVRVVGFVGGPSHVCKVTREAIAFHLDIVWLEPMISEQSPENPPRRSHEAS